MIVDKQTLDLCPVCQQRPLSNWDCPYCRTERVRFRQFCHFLGAKRVNQSASELQKDSQPLSLECSVSPVAVFSPPHPSLHPLGWNTIQFSFLTSGDDFKRFDFTNHVGALALIL